MDLQKRIKFDKEKNIIISFLYIGLYLAFIVVTTIVAIAVRHHYLYYFNNAIQTHFGIDQSYLKNHEWWHMLRDNLHSTMSARDEVNSTTDQDSREISILEENILLGTPRLRQLRVEKEECIVKRNFMKIIQNACYPLYSLSAQRTKGEHQGSTYSSAYNLRTMPISGQIHTYWGGGFVENLYRDLDESIDVISMLESREWLDRGTRLMVFEFTLYNNNTELFNNVKFLGEVLVTGGVLLLLRVQAIQKYALWTGRVGIIVTAAIFYIIALYYIIDMILSIVKEGFKRFSSFWKLVDFVILILVLISFCYNIFHPIYLSKYLKNASANPAEYHSLDVICWLNMHYMNLMAVLAFLVWIKVFQLFNFNKTLLRLKETFLRCYMDLLSYAVVLFIIFYSYAVLGLMLFGHAHDDFHVFPIAFWTVMRMVLVDFDYITAERANPLLGPIYFLTFAIAVCFILVNMFLAVIYCTYLDIKQKELPSDDNQLPKFFRKYRDKLKAAVLGALTTLRLRKRNKGAKSSEPIREIGSDYEPPFPPKAKPKKSVKVPVAELVKNYFEAVKSKRNAEQLDRLDQHISLMEDMLTKMSEDIKRLEAETPDSSALPNRPRAPKGPSRIRVFVNRRNK